MKQVQAALVKVDGVSSATVSMPGSAVVKGSASADDLVAAINGIGGGKYSATAN